MTEQTQTLASGDTETPTEQVQEAKEESKTYTQKEVDNMMGRMKGSLTKKLLKPYEDLGDVEQLRVLKEDAEQRQQEEQIKRGQFEQTLKDLAQAKDKQIEKRDQTIKEYKVTTPLVDAAARYKSINPEQVKSLLNDRVRLNDVGEVEVVGKDGTVQYDDSGNLLSVDSLVQTFLSENPHFVQATPSTTNSTSNIKGQFNKEFDPTKLDYTNPSDRARYADYRKQMGMK